MRIRLASWSGLLLLSLAVAAKAELASRPAEDATVHRHLGFFLRLDLGLGYMGSSASDGATTVTLTGGGGAFSVNIGGAVSENLILSGHLWDSVVVNPSLSVNGGNSVGTNSSLGLVGIGPSITYYFMPTNLYLSGTPALVVLNANGNGTSNNTKVGFGGRLALGKEWWVSDHWGLGVEGQFSFGFNKDSDASNAPTWNTYAGSVAFSATFN